jgi:hypothetical protein
MSLCCRARVEKRRRSSAPKVQAVRRRGVTRRAPRPEGECMDSQAARPWKGVEPGLQPRGTSRRMRARNIQRVAAVLSPGSGARAGRASETPGEELGGVPNGGPGNLRTVIPPIPRWELGLTCRTACGRSRWASLGPYRRSGLRVDVAGVTVHLDDEQPGPRWGRRRPSGERDVTRRCGGPGASPLSWRGCVPSRSRTPPPSVPPAP